MALHRFRILNYKFSQSLDRFAVAEMVTVVNLGHYLLFSMLISKCTYVFMIHGHSLRSIYAHSAYTCWTIPFLYSIFRLLSMLYKIYKIY